MQAMRATSEHLWGATDLAGKRVAVQGVGKVGSDLVRRLVEAGCEVVIADTYRPAADGVADQYGVKQVPPDDILEVDCDILAPCSLGGSLNESSIPALACAAVVGSANNQLATDADATALHERGVLYVPDFVVNAGGLINVYEELRGYEVARARHSIDKVYDNTRRVLETAAAAGVPPQQAAVEVAQDRIRKIGNLRLFRRSGDDRN